MKLVAKERLMSRMARELERLTRENRVPDFFLLSPAEARDFKMEANDVNFCGQVFKVPEVVHLNRDNRSVDVHVIADSFMGIPVYSLAGSHEGVTRI